MVRKWIKNLFSEVYKETNEAELGLKFIEKDGKKRRIQLWDLAGQDKNYLATKIFAKDAHGCVIMSDAKNRQTREE